MRKITENEIYVCQELVSILRLYEFTLKRAQTLLSGSQIQIQCIDFSKEILRVNQQSIAILAFIAPHVHLMECRQKESSFIKNELNAARGSASLSARG